MESRIHFASGRNNRYDSWDMENLKYIRKKSQSELLDRSDFLETESYPSGENQFKESDELFLNDSAMFTQTYSTSKSTDDGFGLISSNPVKPLLANPQYLEYPDHHADSVGGDVGGGRNSCESFCNKNRNISGFPFEQRELPEDNSLEYHHQVGREEANAKFDECYVLDVVTVRNESIFSERASHIATSAIIKETSRVSKIPVFVRSKLITQRGSGISDVQNANKVLGRMGSGSAESASSASSISSIDEAIIADFDQGGRYDTNSGSPQSADETLAKIKPPLYVGGSEGSRSVYSISSDLEVEGHGHEDKQRGSVSSGGCPFCSDSSSISSYYYLGQKKNYDRDSPWGHREETRLQEIRTPSPYYVRLRRDLCNYTPPLSTPRNFGVDKQGHLVIDYSSNWAGLEKYIKKLQIA